MWPICSSTQPRWICELLGVSIVDQTGCLAEFLLQAEKLMCNDLWHEILDNEQWTMLTFRLHVYYSSNSVEGRCHDICSTSHIVTWSFTKHGTVWPELPFLHKWYKSQHQIILFFCERDLLPNHVKHKLCQTGIVARDVCIILLLS